MTGPPRLPSFVRGFGGGLLAGAVGSLGRPGIDVAPAYFGALALLLAVALETSWPRALMFAAAWGLGICPVIALGSYSWGVAVPIVLTLIGCALYPLPIAIWARWAAPRMGPRALFVATASAWSLWMEVGDRLAFPLKGTTLSLVAWVPSLLAGIRIVGINGIEGLLTAGVLVAVRCARAGTSTAPHRRLVRALAPLGATLGLLIALAVAARASAPPALREVRVGVPQLDEPSVYYESRMTAPALATSFAARMHELLAQLRDVDLLVLTESFDGRFGLLVPSLREPWQAYAAAHHQAILFASYLGSPNAWKGNAIGGFDATGRWVALHTKVDLAPFGERHLAAGRDYDPLAVLDPLSVGSLICEESLLPWGARAEARAGAALLAVSTSDETFGSSVLVFEHLAMAQLRAIEVGRAIVWASASGPSSLVDRWGMVGAGASFQRPAAARFVAPLHVDRTPFLRAVAVWPVASAIALVACVLCNVRRRPAIAIASAPRANVRSRLGGGLGQAFMGIVAVSIWFASPALVEMSRGDAARAVAAIPALFAAHPTLSTPDPFARFRTDAAHTSEGATAYYLSYYGAEAKWVTPSGEPRNLDELRAQLAPTLPSRVVPLRADSLPRIATIVQALDGSFDVMTRPTGEGSATLFSPIEGRTASLTVAQLLAAVRPSGVVAAPVVCEGRAGCHAEP